MDVLDVYGFYYQRDRKDPSLGPMSFDYSAEDMCTGQYYYFDEGTRNTGGENTTIENSVQNPLSVSFTGV